jgi:hypothetical protein
MKGWLDNFGKADNANDSNVSVSEDFVGLGYNTKGRNYSPAWGGQFQKGGNLFPSQQILGGGQQSTIQPTVPYLTTKDPSEFYKGWIQSPEYARRQLLTGYSPSAEDESLAVPSAAASRQTRLESLQNIDPITYSTRQPSESRPGVYGIASSVNINPLDYIDTNRRMVEAHELAHIAGAMESEGTTRPGVMSAKEQEIFKKSMLPMKEPVLSGAQGSQQREASKRALEDFEHSKKPKELKADLDALRFTMYDKGIYDITKGQKFTESDFEKAKQNLGKDRVFKRLENRVGKKNFVNLMNTIAKADEEELPMAMGGMSIPGSVGFTYARTAGSAPSEGKYAKKTMASAQKGKDVKKNKTAGDVDSTLENIFEIIDPSGMSSWDDVYKSYQETGMSPQTELEIFGALPFLGKVGKAGKLLGPLLTAGYANKRLKTNANLVSNIMQSIPYMGRGTDAAQAVQQFSDVPFFPTAPPASVGQFGRYAGMPPMDLEKKQNGGEMRFYQNGLDWKPKSMQDGGTEKISINDPRYPELYKNRQVGLSYDGTISLPDLDEVTITAPRSYTMDSLRDFTTAALYGAPANAMKLSMIPQAAMTEGIEALRDKPYDFSNVNPNFGGFASNQRDLSQTMGYENPEGFLQNVVNFGLSAVDPVSLIGAGIADDLTKGVIRKNLKNFRMSAPPEIARGLKTSGLSFNFNNKKLLPNDYSFQSDDNRYWLKHKDKNIGQIEYMSPQLDSQNRKWGTVNIEIDPMYRGKGLSAPMYQKILDHADQLGHYGIVSIDGSLQSPKQSKSIRKYFSGKYSEDPKVLENINKGIDEYNDIIKEDNLIFGDNEPLKPYESKFYLMSNKSKFKKGGVVKDNQGYWNPENWGKPVEIDSNNITMEGVYEPLLGVSDTGDAKLMKPGKNYKFKGEKVTEFPIAQEGVDQIPREQYLSKFKTYDNVLKSMNYTTPYYKDNNIDTSEGDMNCINGVCRIVSNVSGVKFDKAKTKDTYTGNATFADNAMDEGYYRSNPEKEGFGVGDIFQYSRKKSNMASRFPGEVDFRNENDLYPNHAVLIVDEFEKDGQKHFKIANNSGSDKVKLEDVSESELMNRYKEGYKTYDGGITYRYDPDKVTAIKKENQQRVNVLKGNNPYAGQYSKYDSSNLGFYNNTVKNLKMTDELGVDENLQKYADVYSTVYKDLGKGSNMPIDSFSKLILNQIGIAGQETKFGELASNSKDLVPDSLLPIARRSREIYNYNFGTNDNWKKDYWEKNADNVQREFNSYSDFVKSIDSEDSDYNPYRTPRSVGVFQQKDLSERGKFYNYDLDSFEGQVKSSLALAVDNYHKLKTKYPDLSEDEIIDLTTLMHNAPGKALESRFVNYYLKNKDIDYVDKVKSLRPKTIGKKPSTTKKNEEIKFEQISPEKSKSMIDYVNSLQQKKRNGGVVGINQLDAQPMKKLNQLLNFTNNPDKNNWLDKYN